MALQDLHGAIDPAIALGHEGFQRVGHQAGAHALRDIGGLIAGLEQLQAQLGVFGDAPFASSRRLPPAPAWRTMVMVPCWMMALCSLRSTMPIWKKPRYSS